MPASDADLEDAEGEADRRVEDGRCSCEKQMQQSHKVNPRKEAYISSCSEQPFLGPRRQADHALSRQTLPGEPKQYKNAQPARLEALASTQPGYKSAGTSSQKPETKPDNGPL